VYDRLTCPGAYSFEERMGCGFGACMGCSCKTKYGNKRICKEGPVLEKALTQNDVPHIYHVYKNAPHAVGAGKGTDAEGWLNEAIAFWEEQVG